MKRIAFYFVLAGVLLTSSPLQSIAETNSSFIVSSQSLEANKLLLRLHEIKAMDKSQLNTFDKKKLRTEVLSIKQKLSPIGGGVYISAGALIIIILLLIILL